MKRLFNFLLIILLVQLSFGSRAQSCFDEIADLEIPDKPYEMDKNSPEFIDFLGKANCFLGEDLDTIDLEMTLDQNYLKILIVIEKLENKDPITYERLKGLLVEFTQEEEYESVRKLHLLTRDFTRMPAIYNNWEADKHILLKLGIPEERLEPFKNYLKEHPSTGKTYQELMIEFEQSKATTIEE